MNAIRINIHRMDRNTELELDDVLHGADRLVKDDEAYEEYLDRHYPRRHWTEADYEEEERLERKYWEYRDWKRGY